MRRNPNGYGTVSKLSGNRRRPWMARVTTIDREGRKSQSVLGYAETEAEALKLLAKYSDTPWDVNINRVTFTELFLRFQEVKAPIISESQMKNLKSSYKHCTILFDMPYRNIKASHMQRVVNESTLKDKGCLRTLFYQLDRFALECDIISTMHYELIVLPEHTPEAKTPFTPQEIQTLWDNLDFPFVPAVLLHLYTGMRQMELMSLKCSDVNIEQSYIQGGNKTKAGKNRIIPLHPRVLPLVKAYMDGKEPNDYLIDIECSRRSGSNILRDCWTPVMDKFGMNHTTHAARHTFETMLDNNGCNQKCIDLLMGHTSQRIGDRVYNHKTLEQLRDTINTLK